MIRPIPLTTAQKGIGGDKKNRSKKVEWHEGIQMYLGFNIKLLFFSHITKNASLTLCQKVLNTCKYIVNQITRPVYWTTYCIVLFFSMDHFGKLGVNLTLESIYIKGKCAFKKQKHTHTHTHVYTYTYIDIYTFVYINLNINLI